MSDQADCVATRAVPPTIWYDFLPYLDIYLDTTFSAISTELLFFLQQNLIESSLAGVLFVKHLFLQRNRPTVFSFLVLLSPSLVIPCL